MGSVRGEIEEGEGRPEVSTPLVLKDLKEEEAIILGLMIRLELDETNRQWYAYQLQKVQKLIKKLEETGVN